MSKVTWCHLIYDFLVVGILIETYGSKEKKFLPNLARQAL